MMRVASAAVADASPEAAASFKAAIRRGPG